jgi:hypothetical protein
MLKFMHLTKTTELVSGETSVTVLHSSCKSRDRGKNNTGTERESKRMINGGQTS